MENLLAISIVISIIFLVTIKLYSFYKKIFPKLEGLALKTTEEIEIIKEIQLFNIANINKEYEAFGMIESYDIDKEFAKVKLQLKAFELGASAVINVTTNIDNNITGTIGSVRTMPKLTTGKTRTETTYHYIGTAVRFN